MLRKRESYNTNLALSQAMCTAIVALNLDYNVTSYSITAAISMHTWITNPPPRASFTKKVYLWW